MFFYLMKSVSFLCKNEICTEVEQFLLKQRQLGGCIMFYCICSRNSVDYNFSFWVYHYTKTMWCLKNIAFNGHVHTFWFLKALWHICFPLLSLLIVVRYVIRAIAELAVSCVVNFHWIERNQITELNSNVITWNVTFISTICIQTTSLELYLTPSW